MKSPSEKDSYALSEIAKDYKVQVTWACDVVADVAIPILDFYTLQTAFSTIPQFVSMQSWNTALSSSYFVHLSPIAFRGVNVLLEFHGQCQALDTKTAPSPLSSMAEFPIRASEFTGWYYLYNFYLESKIPNKNLLSLTNKLLSIYSIRFLDQIEYVLLENKSPVFDTKFALLPLTKNPTTALCKVPVNTFFPNHWVKYPSEILCNFLGEISYAAAEKSSFLLRTLFSASSILPLVSFEKSHSKSVWRTIDLERCLLAIH